jgi:HEAT repeat protein
LNDTGGGDTVATEQVREILEAEEPDYERAASLGPGILPQLETLVNGPDVGLAAKAASLAGLVAREESVPVLEQAARRQERVVRVAAAAATRHMPPSTVTPVLRTLLEDGDEGVRRMALKSVGDDPPQELRERVAQLLGRGEGPIG